MIHDSAGFPLHERRRAVVELLIKLRAESAHNPLIAMPDLSEVASSLGWSRKSLVRWMNRGGYAPLARESFQIRPEAMRALIRCRGDIRPAYEMVAKKYWDGRPPVTYETFRVAVHRDVPETWKAAMKEGDAARRQQELDIFVGREDLYEVVAFDTKEMSMYAQHPVTGERCDVFVLAPICETSRLVTHVHISPDPINSDDVIAALAGMFVPSLDFPYGGRPYAVRWDNALAHLSLPISWTLASFGIPLIWMDARMPEQNPYAESRNGVLENWARTQPTYKHGPQQRNGEHANRNALLPRFEVVRQDVTALLRNYNTTLIHSALGCTPDAEWGRRPKPPSVDSDQLRWLSSQVTREVRVMSRKGLQVDNDIYVHPALQAYMKQRVFPYKRKNDNSTVEVFDEAGAHICTAIRREEAPDGMWVEVQDGHQQSRRAYLSVEEDALQEADEETARRNAEVSDAPAHTTERGRRRAIAEAEIAAARLSRSRRTERTAGSRRREGR
jgi:hypothetical protein